MLNSNPDTSRYTPEVLRHDWSLTDVEALFSQPFADLIFAAQTIHRQNFTPNEVQLSTLLNIKSGGCPEDCAYCPQSVRHDAGVAATPLLKLDEVIAAAAQAKAQGATRFCMGAAWRRPKDRDIKSVVPMIKAVKELGLETCLTLGMLTDSQAKTLKDSGLDYYNHNLDTSEAYYAEIITTRTFQDRLDTLAHVQRAGLHVCCGGIVGMGESITDRAGMLQTLANMDQHPESVPINQLVPVEGTPLANTRPANQLDIVRTIAVARIMMPKSVVRLSAGRSDMDDATQALCFMSGANSIFYGDTLLITENPAVNNDRDLFDRLGLTAAS